MAGGVRAYQFCSSLIAMLGQNFGLEWPAGVSLCQVETEMLARGYRAVQRDGKWFAERKT